MPVPNQLSVLIQTLSPDAERDLGDAIKDLEAAGLGCSVEHQDLGPQAFVEWLFPTAVLIWVGEKYFGAMLAEAGKDHYKVLKRGLGRLYDKTLGRGASVIRRLRRHHRSKRGLGAGGHDHQARTDGRAGCRAQLRGR